MRFQYGDIVRVSRFHRLFYRNYGNGRVIGRTSDGKVRVRWSNITTHGSNWVERSLRLYRRS